jgi:hypothetical protein
MHRPMNVKKILAIVLALGIGYLAVQFVFWLLGNLFSIMLSVMWLGLIVVFAIPAYLYLRRKLLS